MDVKVYHGNFLTQSGSSLFQSLEGGNRREIERRVLEAARDNCGWGEHVDWRVWMVRGHVLSQGRIYRSRKTGGYSYRRYKVEDMEV